MRKSVFPACAGMFLLGIHGVPAPAGFSPRVRGCSFTDPTGMRGQGVFPACAGMFRFLNLIGGSIMRFPRVCGDVPVTCLLLSRVRRFSPRVRGCSVEYAINQAYNDVFPACAGMFLPLIRI